MGLCTRNCGNTWCASAEIANTSTSTCGRLTRFNVLNSSTPPPWLTIEVSTCTATFSQSYSARHALPSSVSATVTVSLPLSVHSSPQSLTMQAGTMTNTTSRTIIIPPPPPGRPLELSVGAQVAAVAVAGPIAGAVLATSVAGVVQRSTVALRFSSCAAVLDVQSGSAPPRGHSMTVAENPTRLTFGDAAGAMYRGAAVGNMVIIAAVSALIVPVGAIHACRAEVSATTSVGGNRLGAGLAALHLPGRAFVVLAVLLQPTVTAVAGLLMLDPASPGDVMLAIATLCALLALVAVSAWAVRRGCSTLVVAVHSPATGGIMDYVSGRRVVWVPRPSLASPHAKLRSSWLLEASIRGAEQFAQQFDPLIGRTGSGAVRELYFVAGCLWSMVTGVVGALNPSNHASCRVAQVILAAVAVLSLVLIIVVRPFPTPFDRNVSLVMEGLSLVVAVLSLAEADGGAIEVLSYVQIGLSALVSLLRLVTRALQSKTHTVTPATSVHQSPAQAEQSVTQRHSFVAASQPTSRALNPPQLLYGDAPHDLLRSARVRNLMTCPGSHDALNTPDDAFIRGGHVASSSREQRKVLKELVMVACQHARAGEIEFL